MKYGVGGFKRVHHLWHNDDCLACFTFDASHDRWSLPTPRIEFLVWGCSHGRYLTLSLRLFASLGSKASGLLQWPQI